MRTLAKRLFLIPALVALHSGAQSFSTYSTLGEPGDTYNFSSGWLVDGTANPPQPYVGEAFKFTATASGFLSQLNPAISAGNGNVANDLANIFISANNGLNVPGATLETFLNVSCPGPFGVNNPITSLASSHNPLLQAGGSYWLCVEAALPNAVITVNQNSLGILAEQAQDFSPEAWGLKGNRTTFAFDVEVTAVPEPSTTALAALGLAFLIRPPARSFRFNSWTRCKTKAT
jgi:hypothetical protein